MRPDGTVNSTPQVTVEAELGTEAPEGLGLMEMYSEQLV